MDKNCDNCINSGRPSYEWPCTVCTTAYDSAPSKWESIHTTEDFVEVVRCKDCQHCDMYQAEADHSSIPICMLHSFEVVDANGFCYRGERKDNAV